MPITPTYPGVYVEELTSPVHPITGVATSIAAFVGYTASGIDGRAAEIFSFSDYVRSFGGLDSDSELSYAVQQFFQNGGSDAFVVRVPKDGAKPATVVLLAGVTNATASLVVSMLSAGTWSDDVIIDVDYDGVSDPTNGFNLTISNLEDGTVETFENLTMDSAKSNYALTVVNDIDTGSQLVQVALPTAVTLPAGASLPAAGVTPPRPAANGTVSGTVTLPVTSAVNSSLAYQIVLTVNHPTLTNGSAQATVSFITPGGPVPTSLAAMCAQFQTNASAALGQAIPGATVQCTPSTTGSNIWVQATVPSAYDAQLTFASGATTSTTADASMFLQLANVTGNVSHYWPSNERTAFPALPTAPTAQPTVAAEAGATRGFDATALPTAAELVAALSALDKVDLFNILCIPDATRDNTINSSAVFAPALAYCKSRRAFLLIDPQPNISNVPSAINWISGGLSVSDPAGCAAAYFPRLKLPDPLNNSQLRTFAPCGVVAGVYASIDGSRGVWKAPAGIEATLSGVQSMAYKLTDNENGALNPLGLNCLRTFPVYGPISWGARTIAGADALASQWKYVPVRRFALFLEESLYRGTKWVVFEPNDEPLWSAIRLNINSFLQTLFRQGAFQGSTPQDAYFVKCDDETTTQTDINNGIVNIIVGFAPLEPAEFVILQIEQMAGQTGS